MQELRQAGRMTPSHTNDGVVQAGKSGSFLLVLCCAVLSLLFAGALGALPLPPDEESIEDSLYTVESHPWEVAQGDFDNDGDTDLAVNATVFDAVQVLLGNGDGTFQDAVSYWAGFLPMSLVAEDFNEDGFLDLAVSATDSNQLVVLTGFGDGTFGDSLVLDTGDFPINVVTYDVNLDGNADLITSNSHSSTIGVYLGNGRGGFSAPIETELAGGGRSPEFGDLDEDGLPDVAIALRGNIDELGIMFGDGTGAFYDPLIIKVGTYPKEPIIEDLNGDGHLDIALACRWDNQVNVLFGDGTGAFTEPLLLDVGTGPRFLISHDIDGDGVLDLITTNYFGNSLTALLGDGSGGFPYRRDFDIVRGPRGLTMGDFDSDGKVDAAICGQAVDKVSIVLDFLDDVTPYLTNPLDGATISGDPVFRWKDIPGATAYQVFLYDPNDELVWSTFLQGRSEQPYSGYSLLEPGTEYHWAVRERWQNEWNMRSDFSSFVIEDNPNLLPPPDLNLPLSEQTISLPEYFSCVPLENVGSYQFRLYADSAGTELVFDDRSRAHFLSLPGGLSGLSEPGTYFWTARGIDRSGYAGEFSNLRPFVLSEAVGPPEAPVPVSPAGDSLEQTEVTFLWELSAGATHFELEFSIDSLFTGSSDETWSVEDITDTSVTLDLRPAQSTLYWRVRAYNSSGSSGWSTSTWFYFDGGPIAPVQSVEITQPADGSDIEFGSSIVPAGFVSGSHTGMVEGFWILNGTVVDSFSVSMTPEDGARIDGPVISADSVSVDTLLLSVVSPDNVNSTPLLLNIIYPPSGAVSAIHLIASPFALPADGQSTSDITAVMVDEQGRRVYNDFGRPVTFLILGEGIPLSPLSVLTVRGEAGLKLQSTENPDQDVLVFAYSPGVSAARTYVMTYEQELEEYVTRVIAHIDRLEHLPLDYCTGGVDTTATGYDVSDLWDFLNQQILGIPDPPPENVESLKRMSLALTALDLSHYYEHDSVFPEEDEQPLLGWGYLLDQISGSTAGSAVIANYFAAYADSILQHGEGMTYGQRRVFRSVRGISQYLFNTVSQPMLEHTPYSTLSVPVVRALTTCHRQALQFAEDGADPFSLIEDRTLSLDRQLDFMNGVVLTTQFLVDSVAAWASSHQYFSTFEDASARVDELVGRARSVGATAELSIDRLDSDGASSMSAEEISLLGMYLAQGAEPRFLFARLAEISAYVGSSDRWVSFGRTIPFAQEAESAIQIDLLPKSIRAAFGMQESGSPVMPASELTQLGSDDHRRIEALLMTAIKQGSDFESQVRSIMASVSGGQTSVVMEKLPAVCDEGDALLEILMHLRGVFCSFGPDAQGSVGEYPELYEEMTDKHLQVTQDVLTFDTALLDYLANPNFDYTAAVLLQRGSDAISHVNDLIQRLQLTLPTFFDIPAAPVVVPLGLSFPDSVGPGRIFTVSLSLVNAGAGESTDVTAVLGLEGPFDMLAGDTVIVPAIQAGDTSKVSWRLKVKSAGNPDVVRGLHPLVITLDASGGITYPRFSLLQTYYKSFGANWAVARKQPSDDRRLAGSVPGTYALHQNVPNPFNPQTTISFDLPGDAAHHVRLRVYTVRGKLVKTLLDERVEPGRYSLHWDGRSDSGQSLGSGVFFYVLEAGTFRSTRKMILWE